MLDQERVDPYFETTVSAEACRDVLKRRTRYYLALRDAGVAPLGIFILDVIVLSSIEGYSLDIDALADLLNLPQPTVRLQVVALIKDGWVEAAQSQAGTTLRLSEKGTLHAYSWVAMTLER